MTVVVPTNPPLIYLKSYKTASTSFEIALLESVRRSFENGLDEPGVSFHISIDAGDFGLPLQKSAAFFRGRPLEGMFFRKHGTAKLAGKIFGARLLKQHQGAREVRRVVGENFYNAAYKVTTVRNPWDLTVSRYRWTSTGRQGRSRPVDIPFRRFIEGFTGNGRIKCDGMDLKMKPLKQHLYPFVYDQNSFGCNEYIRFEHLEMDAASLFERFGLAAPAFPRVKVSGRTPGKKHYRDYFDDYSAGLVRNAVERFIEDFGYTF